MSRPVSFPDLTIVIPVQFDTFERLENLTCTIQFLKKYLPDSRIHVVEASPQWSTITKMSDVDYSFIQMPEFNRSIALNHGLKEATTEYVANYDTDVLFPPIQFREAKDLLKHYDFVFPYDGRFFKVGGENRAKVIKTGEVDFLNPKDLEINHPQSLGGAIFARRLAYMEICFENPNFKRWGFEDNDRLNRIKLFGKTITRASGPLYHLEHPQFSKENKWYSDPYSSLNEANKLVKMSAAEYRQYATWMEADEQ